MGFRPTFAVFSNTASNTEVVSQKLFWKLVSHEIFLLWLVDWDYRIFSQQTDEVTETLRAEVQVMSPT